MKLINHIRICPMSFKSYGPVCLSFKWNIKDNGIWEWMEHTYPSDASPRLEICSDRQILIQPIRAYFDNLDDAMLFKLTWGGV